MSLFLRFQIKGLKQMSLALLLISTSTLLGADAVTTEKITLYTTGEAKSLCIGNVAGGCSIITSKSPVNGHYITGYRGSKIRNYDIDSHTYTLVVVTVWHMPEPNNKPESPDNIGDSPNNTCNPINIATGNKFFKRNDYRGQGMSPLTFTHYYNSINKDQIWTHDYGQHLFVTPNEIKAYREDGQIISFSIIANTAKANSQRIEKLYIEENGYSFILPDTTVERYDMEGRLVAIKYRSGVEHIITYGENTITVSRLNDSMVLTKNTSSPASSIESVLLPSGERINYNVELVNGINLTQSAVYFDTSTISYEYHEIFPHYITGIIDENGNRISSVAYDDQGRAISSEVGELGSGIERTQIDYHDDGTRTVTNSLGKQNIYHFTDFNGEYKMTRVEGQPSANCAAANQAYTYDDNGFMASKTDWKGNVTTYTHNDRGLETSRTEASGTPQARTITTQWHDTFNLRTQIIHPDTITSFTYDSSGRLLSKEVSPR